MAWPWKVVLSLGKAETTAGKSPSLWKRVSQHETLTATALLLTLSDAHWHALGETAFEGGSGRQAKVASSNWNRN